ncbi:hypothetical protein T265_02510 [Opisthorchis viverrini]|uniref:Uncharacterized protein n=1 Tax=Opisthorchis viverrini TaxID=6198 RepID=A0A075A6F0_OPIVI|nr:hypothetical protein T265_02510 [Opisthorchis viverrini]KER31185.1 hypothetical protein T265_02510 [Opisthorchis viverrini]
MDFQILYGAYVRPLLKCANHVVYSGGTKYVALIECVQRAATGMVAGPKSVNYETRLAILDLFLLVYRRLQEDLILTYTLFEQSLANRILPLTQQTQGGDIEDVCCSPTGLIYGTTLRLPGELYSLSGTEPNSPVTFVTRLRQHIAEIRATPKRRSKQRQHISADQSSRPFVFVQHD